MIEKIYVTAPNKSVLELDLRSSETTHGLLIFNLTGLGSAKANVSGPGSANYDGIVPNVVRLGARQIIITIAITARGSAEETARKKIYDFFPVKELIEFRVKTDGTKDVFCEAYVESVEMNVFNKVENAVISLLAPDPFLYDNTETSTNISTAGTEVSYINDIPIGVTFEITLSAQLSSDILISNDIYTQSMEIDLFFPGGGGGVPSPTQSGDKFIVYTKKNEKGVWFVRGSTWTNLFNNIGVNDDWITLYNGTNTITVETEGGAENGDISTVMKHRPAYGGV